MTFITLQVVLFSQSWCPHSQSAKKILESKGVAYSSIELDEYKDSQSIKDALANLTGAGTTPRVFVAGKFVGGESDLIEAQKNNTLDLVLNAPDFAAQQPMHASS